MSILKLFTIDFLNVTLVIVINNKVWRLACVATYCKQNFGVLLSCFNIFEKEPSFLSLKTKLLWLS